MNVYVVFDTDIKSIIFIVNDFIQNLYHVSMMLKKQNKTNNNHAKFS